MTIHKQILVSLDREIQTNIPSNAVILSAQAQGENLCVWYEVPIESWESCKVLGVFITGNNICDESKPKRFISTVQIGWFVGHVYEYLSPND